MLPKEKLALKIKNLELFCSFQEQELEFKNYLWFRYRCILGRNLQNFYKLMYKIPALFVVPITFSVLALIYWNLFYPLAVSLPNVPLLMNKLIRLFSLLWAIINMVVLPLYSLRIFLQENTTNSKLNKLFSISPTAAAKTQTSKMIARAEKMTLLCLAPLQLTLKITYHVLILSTAYISIYLFLFEFYAIVRQHIYKLLSPSIVESIFENTMKFSKDHQIQYVIILMIIISFFLIIVAKPIILAIKKFLTIYDPKWQFFDYSIIKAIPSLHFLGHLALYYIILSIVFNDDDKMKWTLRIAAFVLYIIVMLYIEYQIDKKLYLKYMISRLIDLYYKVE